MRAAELGKPVSRIKSLAGDAALAEAAELFEDAAAFDAYWKTARGPEREG